MQNHPTLAHKLNHDQSCVTNQLNVLIAIVGDSYEFAMMRSLKLYYRARLELVAETSTIWERFYASCWKFCFGPSIHARLWAWASTLLVSSTNLGRNDGGDGNDDDESWNGRVHAIENLVLEGVSKQLSSFGHQLDIEREKDRHEFLELQSQIANLRKLLGNAGIISKTDGAD